MLKTWKTVMKDLILIHFEFSKFNFGLQNVVPSAYEEKILNDSCHVPGFKIFTILFWKSWVDLPNSAVANISYITHIDSFRWKSCNTKDFVLNLHRSCSEFMWFNALERCWYVLCYQLLYWHFVICLCGFQLMHEKWSPPRFVNFALLQTCLQDFNMSECHLFN